MNVEANGDSGFAACVEAVNTYNVGALGLIMFAIPDGSEEYADDMLLCSTERVLEAAGIEYRMRNVGGGGAGT